MSMVKGMNAIKKLAGSLFISLFSLLNVNIAAAHCPLCTGAVGAAAVGAKYFGVDSSIIGVFIGAFAISTGLWFARWLKSRFQKTIPFQTPIVVILSFILTVVPLMKVEPEPIYFPVLLFGASGSLLNKAYWLNKILFGSALGAIASLAAYWLHLKVKAVKGKVLFPFQGIAFTLLSLAMISLIIFYAL